MHALGLKKEEINWLIGPFINPVKIEASLFECGGVFGGDFFVEGSGGCKPSLEKQGVAPDPAVIFESSTNAICEPNSFQIPDGRLERVILTSIHSLADPPKTSQEWLLRNNAALAENPEIRVTAGTVERAEYNSRPHWLDFLRASGDLKVCPAYSLANGLLRLLPPQDSGSVSTVVLQLEGAAMVLFPERGTQFFGGTSALVKGMKCNPPYVYAE